MIVPFSTLPGTARIWVYQSSKELTADDVRLINDIMKEFVTSWTAHQADLKAGFEVFHNRFLVIGVDENHNNASGCSVDKKVNVIKKLGEQLATDFFNRLQVAYLENDNIRVADMHQVIERIVRNEIHPETIMFNNLVSTKDQFLHDWKIPVSESWLQQLVVK